ncbi:MAG TPA: cation-transporting P-type ATPase [Acidimicrobiales bacterium]|nr:cation-transporting P-type ATPase [Acidimicrobiales bacterium]
MDTPPAPPAGLRAGEADDATILTLDRRQVCAALHSSLRGLSSEEARRRLATVGPNQLPPAGGRGWPRLLWAQLSNMFAVILLVAAGITFLIYGLTTPRDPANLDLAVAILGVVALNAAIGFAQEYAAERTAEALQALVPASSRVLRDGQRDEVPAATLVPGDLVLLEPGDAVSADCRLVEAHDLALDLSALTGESLPVARTSDRVGSGIDPAQARNCVLTGTSVVGGTGRAVVFATGSATEFGRIYRLTAGVPPELSPLHRQVADMARKVALIAVLAGAVVFGVRSGTQGEVVASFVFALGVMVALVPEGLPATLSVSLAIGVRRMSRRSALIKRLAAVETLGSTTVICTDKTGTLTKAEMTVQVAWEAGRAHRIGGVGHAPEGAVEDAGDIREMLRAAALCCDARLVAPTASEPRRGWRVVGDTSEGAILAAAAKAGIDVAAAGAAAPRVAEFPFDSDRKLMTTVHRVSDGHRAYVKGSPQEILTRCSAIRWKEGTTRLTPALAAQVTDANDAMARSAYRVLAVAERSVSGPHPAQDEAEEGLVLLGLVAMSDPPRPEVTDAVAACRRAGIRIVMVTGDYGLTAEAVARRVGIVAGERPVVVDGGRLDAMDDSALRQVLGGEQQVLFARVRPEHKLRVVTALQDMGEVVAVTGDGVNDAPALKRASIGVSMGASGTDVAREASTMVLLDDSFGSIVAAVALGRSVYANIRKFLIYIFSHNLAELLPILAAAIVGFPLVPLTALQVLSIDLGSDVLPGLVLGAEGPEPGIMDRRPRPTTERLFSWNVVRRFLFLGSIESAGVVFAFFWRIHTAHLPFGAFTSSNPTYREALTMTQVGIIVSQFFNAFAVRSEHESIFRIGLLSNRLLLAASFVGIGFAVAVSYAGPLQSLFHTAPLRPSDWLLLVGFGALLLLAEEGRKAVSRLRGRRTRSTRGRETH